MRVGAAFKYCSNDTLFARGLIGSYSTWIVIHTLAAPLNSMSYLWRSRAAVKPGSIKSLVEVGQGVGEKQTLDLAKTPDWSADRVAWLLIEIWNLSRAFSEYSGHIACLYLLRCRYLLWG